MPFIVGGRSDAALRRAGALGDGWLGIWVSPERFADAVATVDAHARAAGRADWHPQHALHLWCGLAADRDAARTAVAGAMESLYRVPYERFERWSPAGTPADVASYLEPFLATTRTVNLIPAAPEAEYAVEAAGEVRRLLLERV